MSRVPLTERDRIIEAVEDAVFEGYPDWSRDQLLCDPIAALRVCLYVQRRLRKRLPYRVILGTWLAAHKRGDVRLRRRRRSSSLRQRPRVISGKRRRS
jgi:hypothetical protein